MITIDGKEFDLESLSDAARAQINSIQAAEQEINRIQAKMALTQTAKNAYLLALSKNLPSETQETSGIVAFNDKSYLLNEFSAEAKAQLTSFKVAEQKLKALESDLAIVKMARVAYARALKETIS